MKIDFSKYVKSEQLLSLFFFISLEGLPESEQALYFKSITSDPNYNGVIDIEFKVNGVEFNAEEFFQKFDQSIKLAETREELKYSKFKEDWLSKHTPNANKAKLVKQLEKANQLLFNINQQLEGL